MTDSENHLPESDTMIGDDQAVVTVEPPTTTDRVEAIMAKHHVEVPEPTAWNRYRERVMYNAEKGRSYVEYTSVVDCVEIVAHVDRLEAMERELKAMVTEKRLTLSGAKAALGVGHQA